MSSQYPSQLDSFVTNINWTSDKMIIKEHARLHNDVNAAVIALQTKLWIDNSASTSSIDYKLKNVNSLNPWHKHDIDSLVWLDNRYVRWPASSVNNNIILFDWTTWRLIKDSWKALPSWAIVWTTDAQILTNKMLNSPILNWPTIDTVYAWWRQSFGFYAYSDSTNYLVPVAKNGVIELTAQWTWTWNISILPLALGSVNLYNTVKFFNSSSATNYIWFKSPSWLWTSKTYVLPSSDWASGQFLMTDWSWNLSFWNPAWATVTYKTIWFVDADYICDWTNDEVQFQQAIDDLYADWGWALLIKSWTYKISWQVTIKTNVNLYWQWASSVLKPQWNFYAFVTASHTDITLQDLVIDSWDITEWNNSITQAVRIQNGNDIRFINCKIINCYGWGVWVTSNAAVAKRVIFDWCYLTWKWNNDVIWGWTANSATWNIEWVIVTNTYIEQNIGWAWTYYNAIDIVWARYTMFVNNELIWWCALWLEQYPNKFSRISWNIMRQTTAAWWANSTFFLVENYATDTEGSHNIIISDNVTDKARLWVKWTSYAHAKWFIISNNNITSPTTTSRPIVLEYVKDSIITNNIIDWWEVWWPIWWSDWIYTVNCLNLDISHNTIKNMTNWITPVTSTNMKFTFNNFIGCVTKINWIDFTNHYIIETDGWKTRYGNVWPSNAIHEYYWENSSAATMFIRANQTHNWLWINQSWVLASNRNWFQIFSDVSQTTWNALARFRMWHGSSTIPTILVENLWLWYWVSVNQTWNWTAYYGTSSSTDNMVYFVQTWLLATNKSAFQAFSDVAQTNWASIGKFRVWHASSTIPALLIENVWSWDALYTYQTWNWIAHHIISTASSAAWVKVEMPDWTKYWIVTNGKLWVWTYTPTEMLDVNGNLNLPLSTSSIWVIKSNSVRYIHNYWDVSNFFAWYQAGNLTLTTAVANTWIWKDSLYWITTWQNNVAVWTASMFNNTTWSWNTSVWRNSGRIWTTSNNCTFIWYQSWYTWTSDWLTNATAIWYNAHATASSVLILWWTWVDQVKVWIWTTAPTAYLDVLAWTTSAASIRIREWVAPSSPNVWDLWFQTWELNFRKDASTTVNLLAWWWTWGSITWTLSSQTDLQSALDAKQNTLVSWTTIKTINWESVLWSWDIVISWGSLSWWSSITWTSWTWLTLTVWNSASASTYWQKIIVSNTQTQAVRALDIALWSAAQWHIWLNIVTTWRSSSQKLINLELGDWTAQWHWVYMQDFSSWNTFNIISIEKTNSWALNNAFIYIKSASWSAVWKVIDAKLWYLRLDIATTNSAYIDIDQLRWTLWSNTNSWYWLSINKSWNAFINSPIWALYHRNVFTAWENGNNTPMIYIKSDQATNTTPLIKWIVIDVVTTWSSTTYPLVSDFSQITRQKTSTHTTWTLAENYNLFYLKRSSIQNAAWTYTATWSVLKVENVVSQLTWVLQDSTAVVNLVQSNSSSWWHILFNSYSWTPTKDWTLRFTWTDFKVRIGWTTYTLQKA